MSKRTKRIPTSEKLALALEKLNAPEWIIKNARANWYDDYKSDAELPKQLLVNHARAAKLPPAFIQQVIDGRFDAQRWEAEEYEKTPEGQALLRAVENDPELPKLLDEMTGLMALESFAKGKGLSVPSSLIEQHASESMTDPKKRKRKKRDDNTPIH